jgi:hypothetical protein
MKMIRHGKNWRMCSVSQPGVTACLVYAQQARSYGQAGAHFLLGLDTTEDGAALNRADLADQPILTDLLAQGLITSTGAFSVT